mgnify:CR=1 FL=1
MRESAVGLASLVASSAELAERLGQVVLHRVLSPARLRRQEPGSSEGVLRESFALYDITPEAAHTP